MDDDDVDDDVGEVAVVVCSMLEFALLGEADLATVEGASEIKVAWAERPLRPE